MKQLSLQKNMELFNAMKTLEILVILFFVCHMTKTSLLFVTFSE